MGVCVGLSLIQSLSLTRSCVLYMKNSTSASSRRAGEMKEVCARRMKTAIPPMQDIIAGKPPFDFSGAFFFFQGAKHPTYIHTCSHCPELHLSATESSYIHICHIYRRPRRRGAVGKTHDQASQVSYICRAYVADGYRLKIADAEAKVYIPRKTA